MKAIDMVANATYSFDLDGECGTVKVHRIAADEELDTCLWVWGVYSYGYESDKTDILLGEFDTRDEVHLVR